MVRFLIYFFVFFSFSFSPVFAFCIFDFAARGISAADDAKDVGPEQARCQQSLQGKARQSCTLVITVMSLGYASNFWACGSADNRGAWQMSKTLLNIVWL